MFVYVRFSDQLFRWLHALYSSRDHIICEMEAKVVKRGKGRPRKYANNTVKMRAYSEKRRLEGILRKELKERKMSINEFVDLDIAINALYQRHNWKLKKQGQRMSERFREQEKKQRKVREEQKRSDEKDAKARMKAELKGKKMAAKAVNKK